MIANQDQQSISYENLNERFKCSNNKRTDYMIYLEIYIEVVVGIS